MIALGLMLFGFLFLFNGYTHLTKHEAMAAYTTSVLGDCPVRTPLGFLGGFPTGIYLVITGVLIAFQRVTGLYMAIGFLVLATALFHREMKEPNTFKNIALIGSALALASAIN